MSFFSAILDKLGLGKKEDKPTESVSATATAAPAPKPAEAKQEAAAAPKKEPAKTPAKGTAKREVPAEESRAEMNSIRDAQSAPVAMSEVDVVAKLEKMAEGSGFDWKVSIVDLLKVLGLDSSKNARIDLAKELNCPAELIGGDYSKMNVWLHKEVLKRIAANGGNIPKNLLN